MNKLNKFNKISDISDVINLSIFNQSFTKSVQSDVIQTRLPLLNHSSNKINSNTINMSFILYSKNKETSFSLKNAIFLKFFESSTTIDGKVKKKRCVVLSNLILYLTLQI